MPVPGVWVSASGQPGWANSREDLPCPSQDLSSLLQAASGPPVGGSPGSSCGCVNAQACVSPGPEDQAAEDRMQALSALPDCLAPNSSCLCTRWVFASREALGVTESSGSASRGKGSVHRTEPGRQDPNLILTTKHWDLESRFLTRTAKALQGGLPDSPHRGGFSPVLGLRWENVLPFPRCWLSQEPRASALREEA